MNNLANIFTRRTPGFSFVFLCVLIFAAACGNRNQQHQVTEKGTISRPVQDTLSRASVSERGDSLITVAFPSGDSSVVISGTLGAPGSHVSLIVSVQHRGRLVAALVPSEPSANIRFSQVIYPDGKADGPFGREISIPAEQKGIYRLIISHNLMAEGAAAGDFKVQISIESLPAAAENSGR